MADDELMKIVLAQEPGVNLFLQRHLWCGHSSWPEGRLPTPSEIPHLVCRVEEFDTFVELTWRCHICQVSETLTVHNMIAWQRLRSQWLVTDH